jgi:hypothetical protein
MPIPDPTTLRRLYQDEGQSIRAIARLARCRPRAVLDAMEAAGIPRRRPGPQRTPLPDWDRDQLRRLVKVRGLAYTRAFARRHGVNREKLAVLLGRRGLPRGVAARQVVVAHDGEIRAAYEQGIAIRKIATNYGCSERAIRYSLDRTCGNQPDGKPDYPALTSGRFPHQEGEQP